MHMARDTLTAATTEFRHDPIQEAPAVNRDRLAALALLVAGATMGYFVASADLRVPAAMVASTSRIRGERLLPRLAMNAESSSSAT